MKLNISAEEAKELSFTELASSEISISATVDQCLKIIEKSIIEATHKGEFTSTCSLPHLAKFNIDHPGAAKIAAHKIAIELQQQGFVFDYLTQHSQDVTIYWDGRKE